MSRTWTGNITKGIKLEYSTSPSPENWTEVEGLQDIPDIGGTTESIEVTCLDDGAHTYIPGLKDNGDSIDFTLLHNATQFAALYALTGAYYWKVSLPDGAEGAIDTVATFQGIPNIRIKGEGTNAALHDILSIKPTTEITFA